MIVNDSNPRDQIYTTTTKTRCFCCCKLDLFTSRNFWISPGARHQMPLVGSSSINALMFNETSFRRFINFMLHFMVTPCKIGFVWLATFVNFSSQSQKQIRQMCCPCDRVNFDYVNWIHLWPQCANKRFKINDYEN